MTARPILFSAPMVLALLAGRKTQTRRVVKLPHSNPLGEWEATSIGGGGIYDSRGRKVPHQGALWHTRTGDVIASPYGQPGNLLWVREAWAETTDCNGMRHSGPWPDRPHTKVEGLDHDVIIYRADGGWEWLDDDGFSTEQSHWKPSIHMPRWASRLTLRITDVRVQRLRDISPADALSEGLLKWPHEDDYAYGFDGGAPAGYASPTGAFSALWASINGSESWADNPWVWALTFEVIQRNVDAP